ncbi:MAG TPA: TlpA disulfide reductase family protein [Dehalococcoidia bacterium]|nr:TlpA disulfide reductase family protein [Dehalococcoidia bacterium]
MQRSLRGRLLAFAGIVVIAGSAYLFLAQAGVIGGPKGIEPAEIVGAPEGVEYGTSRGDLAPDFVFSDLGGNRHQLSDFRGKVVLLNFWASWCLPCAFEMPELAQFQNAHRDEVAVIALNRAESLDRARSYLDGVTLPDGSKGASFAVAGSDPTDAVYERYRALGMPASFFIDSAGRIAHTANGPILLEQMEEALATTP